MRTYHSWTPDFAWMVVGLAYLAAFIDAHSRRRPGWRLNKQDVGFSVDGVITGEAEGFQAPSRSIVCLHSCYRPAPARESEISI
jgi:hypothetical protein